MNVTSTHRDPLIRQVAKTRVVLWVCALVVLSAISVRWWPMGTEPHRSRTLDAEQAGPTVPVRKNLPPAHAPRPRRVRSRHVAGARRAGAGEVCGGEARAATAALDAAVARARERGRHDQGGLYDSAADRVRVVAVGDSIGDRTVERIDPQGVAIRDGAGVRTLALKGGGSP
jgi:hypothetical protein